MNTKLFEAFTNLDEDLLERSEGQAKRRGRVWVEIGALAACAVVVVALALPRDLDLEESVIDPSANREPSVTQEPSAPTEDSGDKPQDYPTASTEPVDDRPTDHGPTAPPELAYNEMAAEVMAPPVWLNDVTVRTPMSAYQLELVWSVDCPTAFLEEGDEKRFYYNNSVSGTAEYFSDGTLYRLALTFREEGNPVPVTVTVSPADGPLFTGCLPVEEGEADLVGSMGVSAYRYDFGERILLAAETVIGDVRYRFTAETPPEGEEEARQAVYAAVTRFQFNIFFEFSPRLDTFAAGDPTSGEPLVGRTLRTLLILEDKRGAEPVEYIVDRDGRVFDAQGDVLLSHEAQIELRGLVEDLDEKIDRYACGHESPELTLTVYDPWNQVTGTVTGCAEDCEVIERVVEILTREGVLDE